ncbi:DNA-binding response regulator [Dyella solisilvae]|uniref:DNA-binding response regulator n=1 Tax=Dyella solisilvae TaxID=1920168 RepID=A0A370KA21_9GAMM|nr:response regulator transcription factor [Dyella solisilvae]RDI99492.1 DNA-binding response regulator [Dyella solisilvae]
MKNTAPTRGKRAQRFRVLLADEHRCVAEGLAGLLAKRMESVRLVHDGEALMQAVLGDEVDLVITDIAMPPFSALQALRRLRRQGSAIPVVVLSTHAEPLIVREAMRAGANGYVLKQSPSEELFTAIAEVTSGNQFISPNLMASLLQAPEAVHRLTRRQRDVIECMARGRRTSEIALELGISVRTVESHRQALLELLGVHSGVALIREAERLGLIPLAPYEAVAGEQVGEILPGAEPKTPPVPTIPPRRTQP